MRSVIGTLALSVAFVVSTAILVAAAGSPKAGMTAEPKKSAMKYDTKPGPSFQTVDGKLTKIDGNIYIMEDYTGKEMRLYISKDTKKIKGDKKPGDTIRAEVTKGWHANSIQ